MKYVYVFFASVVLSVINCFLGSGYIYIGSLHGFKLSILSALILYLVFTFIVLKKSKQSNISWLLLVILLGCLILDLPVHILDFKNTLMSLLDLPCRWLAIIVAYFCYRWQNYMIRLFSLVILYLIFAFWLTFEGFDLWVHKLNFGTFTGKVIEDVAENDIVFTNELGEKKSINQLHGEYIVLDFWFTGCRICFDTMPNFQKLYNLSNSNKVGLFSVCCYKEKQGEDYLTGRKVLSERGYDYPVLSINIKDPLLQNLGVSAMPMVLIFNSERKLIFRGSLEYAEDFMKDFKCKI